MKTAKVFLTGSSFFLLVYFISCRKNVDSPVPTDIPQLPDSVAPLQTIPNQDSNGYHPFPENYSMNCPGSPSYGDSIVYPSGNYGAPDYLLSPVNNPEPGHYYSWPVGLVINDSTGTINVTRSETGLRYFIGYVKKGSQDTCINTLIIGGAAYIDSIYTQSRPGPNRVLPYFNANSGINSLCGPGPLGHCWWDLSQNAKNQKIVLDEHTGVIDLDQTIQKGAFGKNPVDGATLNAVIYYMIGEGNSGIQSLKIQLMYYDRASSIP
ncbi:MAG TPA: hypothetical protein VGM24_04655, partial [Puia sp.]